MEDFNAVNAAQENVVDSQETADVASEATVESVQTEQPQGEATPPKQSQEDNAKYAEARRKAEAEVKAERARNERLLNALKSYGYDGSPEEIADTLLAQSQGISTEEAKSMREKAEAEQSAKQKTEAELAFLRNTVIENMKAKDFEAIKAAYPDLKAKSIDELGETFNKIFNVGVSQGMTAVEAYEAARVIENRGKKPVPPALGATNESTQPDKYFYTSEEVDHLTAEDYDRNPSLLGIVRKSMYKWPSSN